MATCNHKNLVLLPGKQHRLRCRHCYLTLMDDELDDGYCPECYETEGQKRYDFEKIEVTGTEETRYRCESCHIVIAYK